MRCRSGGSYTRLSIMTDAAGSSVGYRAIAALKVSMLTAHTGHLLVATRNHKVKVADMDAQESQEIGEWPGMRIRCPFANQYRLLATFARENGCQSNRCNRLQHCTKQWSARSASRTSCTFPHHPQARHDARDQEQELDYVWERAARRSG